MSEQDETIRVGDRVKIFLGAPTFSQQGWFSGTVVRIEPYSAHRSFHWVELDEDSQAILGKNISQISVFNPKNIQKI